jgi:MYXO-CTERM domain-containing protein
MAGNAVNTVTGETSPFTGVFTMQFAGHPYQDIAAGWAAGLPASGSFSATITVVPEPGMLGLAGAAGLLALRRRTHRA